MTPADWANPEDALRDLFTLAEAETLDTIDWYLDDKRSSRAASRLLRAGAIIFASAGGIFPLVVRSATEVNWGYLMLGLANLAATHRDPSRS